MTIAVEERLRLPLSWSFIEGVRATVSEHLRDAAAELRESAVMAASELSENVVKYGEPVPEMECGYFAISVEPNRIVLRTINGVLREERALEVERRIQEITSADDVGALYTSRMREMLHSPNDLQSYLGLLRIADEGAFRLSCSYDAPLLTIGAERDLP